MTTKGTPAKSKPKATPKETLRHYQAFLYYWGLDRERTHKKVAAKSGVSLATVKAWASRYSWTSRIVEMERKVAEKLEAESIGAVARAKKTNLDILANLRTRFMAVLNKDMQSDNPKNYIETVADFDRLIKAELLLMDQPTERVAGGVTFISSVASPDDAD